MTYFQPGQNVVIIQTFKTEAFNNGKSMGSKLKFQAGRKGTFTRSLNVPKFLTAPARDIYVFVLPYGATRYEVRLSLDEVKKYLAVEGQSSNEQIPQIPQDPQKWTSQIPQIQQPLAVVQTPQLSRADEIAKLAELKERGLLTDEEFAIEKTRVLNQPGN
jgi:hypothetical protein